MTTYPPSTNLLASLSPRDRADLFTIGSLVKFEKNALIFREGAPSTYVYVILEGRAKIYELSPQGKEVIMWFCFSGELFGLAEMWRETQRDVYAQACSPVELIRFDRRRFRQYIKGHPVIAMQVIDILAGRLRILSDMLLGLTATNVKVRLIKLLARLFQHYGRHRGGRIYIDIPLTHQEMADMIGCCRQTVTSTLGVLRRTHGLGSEQRMLYVRGKSPRQAAESLAKLGMDLARTP